MDEKKRKRKRKKPNTPRCWRMTRSGRLQSARHWIPTYPGKDIVRGYAKHYKTSLLCAGLELQMLGAGISAERIAQLRQDEIRRADANRKRREERLRKLSGPTDDYDDTFAYIVGSTPGGVPYGVTWGGTRRRATLGGRDQVGLFLPGTALLTIIGTDEAGASNGFPR